MNLPKNGRGITRPSRVSVSRSRGKTGSAVVLFARRQLQREDLFRKRPAPGVEGGRVPEAVLLVLRLDLDRGGQPVDDRLRRVRGGVRACGAGPGDGGFEREEIAVVVDSYNFV